MIFPPSTISFKRGTTTLYFWATEFSRSLGAVASRVSRLRSSSSSSGHSIGPFHLRPVERTEDAVRQALANHPWRALLGLA